MSKTSWIVGGAGLLMGIILSASFGVMADGDPTTDDVPRTLPYQGVLELNGEPVNAEGLNALHILFELYDGQDAEAPAYSQPIIVEVYSGRFTATIGPLGLNADNEEVIVSEVITAADDLYLGMTLLGDPDNPEDDIALSNRQRIHASPYAMWTTSATNFNVARDAVVGRNLEVGANLIAGGDVAVGGAIVPRVGDKGLDWPDNAFGGSRDDAWIRYYQDGEGEDTALQIGVDNDVNDNLEFYQNGAVRMNINGGNVNITNNLDVGGSINGNFGLSVSGDFTVGRDSSGSDREFMGSTDRRFCFLTMASYKDIEGGSERATCQVDTNSGQWRVNAIVQNSSDANADCKARCISW